MREDASRRRRKPRQARNAGRHRAGLDRAGHYRGLALELRRGWLLAALAWAGLLALTATLRNEADWLLGLVGELRFSGLQPATARAIVFKLLWQAAAFAPLGVLVAAGITTRRHAAWAKFAVGALALGVALFAALVTVGVGMGSGWAMPGIFQLIMPWVGCALGVLLGGALRRRLPEWPVSLLGRGVAAVLLVVLGVFALGRALLLEEPAPLGVAEMSSDEKRALVEKLRRHNPIRVADEQLADLILSPRELEGLLSWGVLLVDDQGRVAVRETPEGIAWRASAAFPIGLGRQRYLTMGGLFSLEADLDGVYARRCALSVGTISPPQWACRSLLNEAHRLFFAMLGDESEFHLQSLQLDGTGLLASYGRLEFGEGSKQRLRNAVGPGWEVQAAARAQFERLRAHGPTQLPRNARFTALLRDAFALAAARSEGTSAVAENQGLIIALATVFGHPDIATIAGIERPEDWQDLRSGWWPMGLHDRSDWVRHFLVSAAITQSASAGVSDAAGLLKEELDAGGRSGFSFGDLLADRAGTVFGEFAMGGEAEAAALQSMVVKGVKDHDLMPPGTDLPERISDAELETRFGGVGGTLYEAVVLDIETRILGLPVMQLRSSRDH